MKKRCKKPCLGSLPLGFGSACRLGACLGAWCQPCRTSPWFSWLHVPAWCPVMAVDDPSPCQKPCSSPPGWTLGARSCWGTFPAPQHHLLPPAHCPCWEAHSCSSLAVISHLSLMVLVRVGGIAQRSWLFPMCIMFTKFLKERFVCHLFGQHRFRVYSCQRQ